MAASPAERKCRCFAAFIEQNSNCILYIQYDSDGKQPFAPTVVTCLPGWTKPCGVFGKRPSSPPAHCPLVGIFTHTVQRIGLNNPQTFRAESPFDYKRNCILYFPKRTSTPFDEVEWLSQEIEQLRYVCPRSRAGAVHVLRPDGPRAAEVAGARSGVPLLTARRNGQLFVQAFKQLSNAVLFAAGPCWEGVDFPGDRVSARSSSACRSRCRTPSATRKRPSIPTCTAISRPRSSRPCRKSCGRALAAPSALKPILAPLPFWTRVLHPEGGTTGALDALPKMNMTQDIKDVEHFIRAVKGAGNIFLPETAPAISIQH